MLFDENLYNHVLAKTSELIVDHFTNLGGPEHPGAPNFGLRAVGSEHIIAHEYYYQLRNIFSREYVFGPQRAYGRPKIDISVFENMEAVRKRPEAWIEFKIARGLLNNFNKVLRELFDRIELIINLDEHERPKNLVVISFDEGDLNNDGINIFFDNYHIEEIFAYMNEFQWPQLNEFQNQFNNIQSHLDYLDVNYWGCVLDREGNDWRIRPIILPNIE